MSNTHYAVGGLSKASKHSRDSLMGALDLLQVPPTNTHIVSATNNEHQSNKTPPGADEIVFEISETDEYISLADTKVALTVKIVRTDGTDCDADGARNIIPETNFGHSLFDKVTLVLNGQEVDSVSDYAHHAYLENLLDTSKNEKDTIMRAEGWWSDGVFGRGIGDYTAGQITARRTFTNDSPSLNLEFVLKLPFFDQKKFLGPRNKMRLILRRSDDKTSLLAADNAPAGGCKVVVEKASLLVRTVEPNPAIRDAHEKHLLKGNSPTYHLNIPNTDWFTVATGTYGSTFNIGSNLRKPKSLYIAVIPQAARRGELSTSAFSFGNHSASSVEVRVNGTVVGGRPVTTNYQTDDCVRSYGALHDMFRNSKRESGVNNGLTFSDFKNYACITAFDLFGDMDMDALHLVVYVSIQVSIKFSAPLGAPCDVMVYRRRDGLATVDVEGRWMIS